MDLFFHGNSANEYVTTHLFGDLNKSLDESVGDEVFDLNLLQNQSFRNHVANMSFNMTFAKKQLKTEKKLN